MTHGPYPNAGTRRWIVDFRDRNRLVLDDGSIWDPETDDRNPQRWTKMTIVTVSVVNPGEYAIRDQKGASIGAMFLGFEGMFPRSSDAPPPAGDDRDSSEDQPPHRKPPEDFPEE